MGVGVKNCQKLRDVIYGRPLTVLSKTPFGGNMAIQSVASVVSNVPTEAILIGQNWYSIPRMN